MLRHVTVVQPTTEWRLHLTFDDGVEGDVDIAQILGPFRGVFAPLQDSAYFRRVYVHPEFLVVTWPNGADLDSDALYEIVQESSKTTLAALA